MRRAQIHYTAQAGATAILLTLAACGNQPQQTAPQGTQPDTVVTSRSEGRAVPNPRRGSFKKSDPNAKGGYHSPD
jgi:hypothetical protein